jgi:hypothetical protein
MAIQAAIVSEESARRHARFIPAKSDGFHSIGFKPRERRLKLLDQVREAIRARH